MPDSMFETKFHNEDLSKFCFLVTGGAGFIGSNIVEYLLKYNAGKVRVLDNLSTGYEKNIAGFYGYKNFEFQNGDIRNIEDCGKACEGIDFVFHQAALGSVPRSIKDPATTNAVNVSGFLNMLVAAKDNKVKRFIYASSSSTYGDSHKLPKVEEEIGNLLSPYAVSKRANELYADVFALTYGLKIFGLRYFNVFGPRQNTKGPYAAVIALFINSLLNNIPVNIDGDGEQSRDFTFVENAVQANIRAAFTEGQEKLNEIYNIALGGKSSVNKIFNTIKKLSHSEMHPIYRQERPGDVRNSLADISKAKKLLGYNPAIEIEQGLEITYNWFVKNKEFINKE